MNSPYNSPNKIPEERYDEGVSETVILALQLYPDDETLFDVVEYRTATWDFVDSCWRMTERKQDGLWEGAVLLGWMDTVKWEFPEEAEPVSEETPDYIKNHNRVLEEFKEGSFPES